MRALCQFQVWPVKGIVERKRRAKTAQPVNHEANRLIAHQRATKNTGKIRGN